MNAILLCVFASYFGFQTAVSTNVEICENINQGECQKKNPILAILIGRRCRKACFPESPETGCKRGLSCLCARECGYSCIKTGKQCPEPPPIAHMSRVVVYRRNRRGCYYAGVASNFTFDDMAIYQCQEGYSLRDHLARHYCTGRSRWTHVGYSVCERTRCTVPFPPFHGTITPQERYVLSGASITYRCDPGYEMRDLFLRELTSPCLDNGRLLYPVPTCVVSQNVENNPCDSEPCLNNGICLRKENRYQCVCRDPTFGTNCEHGINPCSNNPCQNSGTCVAVGSNRYQCRCIAGYQGSNCQEEINPCNSQPCQNGGTCVVSGRSYLCLCAQHASGNNCETEIRCETPQFPDHGFILADSNSVAAGSTITVRCDPGYAVDGIAIQSLQITCQFDRTFSPPVPNCREINPCNSQPCQHGGTCVVSGRSYLCLCGQHASGNNCEIVENHCYSSPCLNGGICTSQPRRPYVCTCPPNYGRRNCESRTCSLNRIPSNLRILNQRPEGVYYEGEELEVNCAEPHQRPVLRINRIRCRLGEVWSPNYKEIRCL